MAKKDISSMRSALEFLKEQGDVLEVSGEVDPIHEISAITKSFDGGPVLLFDKIKGYPNARDVSNVMANENIYPKMFDASNDKEMMRRAHEALLNPIPPKIVEDAPVQEVVITEDIDVFKVLPLLKHTPEDAGRILGGLNVFISGKYFNGGNEISFKRTHFQGPDWGTIMAGDSTHIGKIIKNFRPEKIPVTLNLCTPPAVLLAAGGTYLHAMVPFGSDEVGFAGGLQGHPVEIVKAKTVDAYAIAQAEWVVEGYIDTSKNVWESDEAAKSGKWEMAPYFPEYTGYLGGAVKTSRIQVTAITHRKERPIFFSPLAHSFEGENLMRPFRAAAMYEWARRITDPAFVADVNVLQGQKGLLGVVFQVSKTKPRFEGYQKTLLYNILTLPEGPQVGIAVDDDVDIYNAEDVIWAMTTRVNPETGIVRGWGDRHRQGNPMEELSEISGTQGFYGIDATIPFGHPLKVVFKQGKYPIDQIDLKKWFTDEQIADAQGRMCEYAKVIAKRGS
ncbi:MAG: UbiD family decarboxylase [Deltaproteobacteria bacterium]|nr:UbiD family decarboxylase [Deltaproteobacteria bacterium]